MVAFASGHTRSVKQVHGGDCPACADKIQREAAQRRKAKKMQHNAAREEKRLASLGTDGRLPDGSAFEVHYHAGQGIWTGTLDGAASGSAR